MKQEPVQLARCFLGWPFQGFYLGGGPKEPLLALSNSRKVDMQVEGVERFTQHVRRLR